MVFEQIEQLKDEYTDKYVVVKGERPELRRFQGLTGTVRTVNMSGRALVEFAARRTHSRNRLSGSASSCRSNRA